MFNYLCIHTAYHFTQLDEIISFWERFVTTPFTNQLSLMPLSDYPSLVKHLLKYLLRTIPKCFLSNPPPNYQHSPYKIKLTKEVGNVDNLLVVEVIVIKAQTTALHEPVLQVSVCRARWRNRKASRGNWETAKQTARGQEEASNSSKGIKRGPRARWVMPRSWKLVNHCDPAAHFGCKLCKSSRWLSWFAGWQIVQGITFTSIGCAFPT